jgi:hypothetical protein
MKFKHLLLLAFATVFFAPELFAQKGFSIGCSANYLQSYRRLKNGDGDPYFDKTVSLRNDIESPTGAMQYSIDGIYQYKNNLTLSFGADYSNVGYQYKNSIAVWGDYYSPKRGWTNSIPNLDNIDIRFRLLRLSLPVMLGYKLSLGKESRHALHFRLGFSNHIILKTQYTVVYKFNDGSKETEDDEIKGASFPFNVSACASIGYYYKMNRHSVGVNLVGDYGFTSVSDLDSPIRELPYAYGIGLSYLYTFH